MLQSYVIAQDANVVTVKMSRSRWNRLQKLEESYKVAASIRKGLKQIEKASAMSMEEAVDILKRMA